MFGAVSVCGCMPSGVVLMMIGASWVIVLASNSLCVMRRKGMLSWWSTYCTACDAPPVPNMTA